MPGLTAYGHSWVAGEGASRPSRGFAEVAARELGCTLTNLGVGGSSSLDTADLLLREPAPASRLYVIMTGLNDARLLGATPAALESYGAALGTIFVALERASPSAGIVTIEQPHLVDYSLHAPHDRGSNRILDVYNEQLATAASRRPGVVVATVAGWDAMTMLDQDTVHPNDAGHDRVASAVVRAARTELH